jgi:hypothetical protein
MTTPPHPSDPLGLEVALLAGPEPAPAPIPVEHGSTPAYAVVVFTGDEELDRYLAACLAEDPDLRVLAPAPGERLPDAVRRLAPRLLVSTPAALPAPPLRLPASLLLVLEERHEQDAWLAAPDHPVGVLLQPVSARRLREAVQRLRGPARPDVTPVT